MTRLVMGRTLPEAFIKHWSLQRACEIQVATLSMGQPLHVPQEVLDVHQRDLKVMQGDSGAGLFDFGAWMRKMDRIDPSYKE